MNELQKEKNRKTNMKVLKWIGGILVLLFLLATCVAMAPGDETSTESAPQSNVTDANNKKAPQSTPKKTGPSESPDERFAKRVSPALPLGVEVRHAKNNADVVCKRLDNGDDPNKVLRGTQELRGKKAGTVIFDAAIEVYCPKYKRVLG